jgi:hypothetical protein
MEKLATSASLMGQRKGRIFFIHFIYSLIAPYRVKYFSPCRQRKPRKNTTKYGLDAKIPTKRRKKQDKEPENPSMQFDHATWKLKLQLCKMLLL